MKAKFGSTIAQAEEARDKTPHDSFLSGLFDSQARFELAFPYPKQSEDDRVEGQKILDALDELLRKTVNANEIDKRGEISDEALEGFRRLGLTGVKIPKSHGGLGLSQVNYMRLAELLGSRDASIAALISAHNSIGVPTPLMMLGTEEQKNEFAPQLAAGDFSAFALTEDEAGCDLFRIRTYAVRIRDTDGSITGYRLYGKKRFTTNLTRDGKTPFARWIIYIARIVDDPSEIKPLDTKEDAESKKVFGAFIVDTRNEELTVLCRNYFTGIGAIYNGNSQLEGVYVPEGRRLRVRDTEGRPIKENDGITAALTALGIGRLTLPACSLGNMKKTLQIARHYAAQRITLGRPIGEHEQLGKFLCDMAANVYAAGALLHIAGTRTDEKQDIRLESAVCKVLITEWGHTALNDRILIRGGRGIETDDSLFAKGEPAFGDERDLRDSLLNRIGEGANTLMNVWMAREELDPYKIRGDAILQGSLWEKVKAVLWFIRQFLKPPSPVDWSDPMFENAGPLLHHMEFIRRRAKALTRNTVLASIFIREKLEVRQLVLARLAMNAAYLWAMAAVCARAASDAPRYENRAYELADYFCKERRKEIEPARSLFSQIFRDPNAGCVHRLAKRILKKEMLFLEEGIIKVVND